MRIEELFLLLDWVIVFLVYANSEAGDYAGWRFFVEGVVLGDDVFVEQGFFVFGYDKNFSQCIPSVLAWKLNYG